MNTTRTNADRNTRSLLPEFLRRGEHAFSLVEIMVAIIVLTFLVLIATKIFSSASTITTITHSRIDDDNQARPILDRMTVDFAQMVKRSDVDFFGKNTNTPNSAGGSMGNAGGNGVNDQVAFFSSVQGYYPSTGSQSPLSLVAYRINSKKQLERMGKGLVWNGVSSTNAPIVFLPMKIVDVSSWSAATSTTATDSDYEVIGPNVFRFEYYYQLNQYTAVEDGYSDSLTPWDEAGHYTPAHDSVSGLRDVGAIVVTIATIDPASRVLLTDSQMTTLIGKLVNYKPYNPPGNSGKVGAQMQEKWNLAIDNEVKSSSSTLPKAALAKIRFYERYIYLNGQQQ